MDEQDGGSKRNGCALTCPDKKVVKRSQTLHDPLGMINMLRLGIRRLELVSSAERNGRRKLFSVGIDHFNGDTPHLLVETARML